MDELDDAWFQMLIAAGKKAELQGRDDVAEYLRLKATNDVIRAGAVKWLLDIFIGTALQAEPKLKIERTDGHAFPHGTATMAGTLISLRFGVRCLSIEAGWARTPAHGIMRGQALARANVVHFGRRRNDQALKLTRAEGLPEWLDESGRIFKLDDAERHLRLLLSD